MHCHGISGDGAGPTAAFLNPYPRDYREGWFKFKSTKLPDRPTAANLMRTLHEGISGTAMPSFKLMPEIDRDALVEYVRYLSIRGETELELAVRGSRSERRRRSPSITIRSSEILDPIAASWQKPTEVAVTDRPADMQFDKIEDAKKQKEARNVSIALGAKCSRTKPSVTCRRSNRIYQGAACIKCHGPTGAGRRSGDRLRRLDEVRL